MLTTVIRYLTLFVIFNSRELYEVPNLTAPLKGIVLVSSFLSNLDKINAFKLLQTSNFNFIS